MKDWMDFHSSLKKMLPKQLLYIFDGIINAEPLKTATKVNFHMIPSHY
jgi:hypothetical protein